MPTLPRRHQRLRALPGPPLPLPRALDRLAERWWAATPRARSALGLLIAVAILAAAAGHATATPYGPPRTVLVATRDLSPGQVLTDADLRPRSMPSDLVPDGALGTAAGVLAAMLPRGAVATARHLGDGGWAAGLPTGRAAVAVAIEQLPPLTAGTRVALVGNDHDGRAATLGRDAVVLAVEPETVWFSVEVGEAVDVTGAAAIGRLAVVVLPP
ncbi:MAG: SAF domain-containing protein [Nitriliruptoraceae bacterium]